MLSKEHLVMNEIINALKSDPDCRANVRDVYSGLVSNGRFINYITRSRFFSIIGDMSRYNVLHREDHDTIMLKNRARLMTSRDIIAMIIAISGRCKYGTAI